MGKIVEGRGIKPFIEITLSPFDWIFCANLIDA